MGLKTEKIVIFDLFETLVSEFDAGHPSITEVAQTLGLPVEDFQREYQNLRPARYTGQLDYAVSLRYIVGKLRGKSPESTIRTLAARRQSAFATHLRSVEPEILNMLNEITTSGIRLGLISNTDGTEVLDWQNSPLPRFFEVTIFSHAVGIVKPDPHIYQHACKNLGVALSDCIFIMLKELWGVSIKVPNLEQELEFHQQLGNRIWGDYTFELEDKSFRVVCVVTDDRAAGQHLFLAETHVIEHLLQETFPYGMTHLIYNNGAWGIDEMKKQAAKIVSAGGTLISGPFQLSSDTNNPFAPKKKNPETFAMFLRSPGGYLFELFTLEAFDRMDWIYYPREDHLGGMKLI